MGFADVHKSKNEGSQEMDDVSGTPESQAIADVSDTSKSQELHQKVFQQFSVLIEKSDLEFSSLEDYIKTFDFTCSNAMQF